MLYQVCRECPEYMPNAAMLPDDLCRAHREITSLTADLAQRTEERDRWQDVAADLTDRLEREGTALAEARVSLAESREVLADVRTNVHVQEHGGYAADATPADQCDRWVCGIVNRALAARPSEAGAMGQLSAGGATGGGGAIDPDA
jgi:hypothetical protein